MMSFGIFGLLSLLVALLIVGGVIFGVFSLARRLGRGPREADGNGSIAPVSPEVRAAAAAELAAPAPTGRLARLVAWLDDAANPIVVKELRQAVSSRFVTGALFLMLLVQVAVVALFMMFDDGMSTSFRGGREIFMTLFMILTGISMLFVPTYTAARMSAERNDQNVDLLFVTTIRPRAIVLGKIVSAIVLAVLLYAACMPFMTFTYLLRGIDLPTIFLSLAASFLLVVGAIVAAVFLASIRGNMAWRGLLGLFQIGIAIMGISMTATVTLGLSSGLGGRIGEWEFWAGAGSVVLMGLLGMGFLIVLAVALLSPPSSNRTMPVRIYISAMLLVSGVVAAAWSWLTGDGDMLLAWGIGGSVLMAVALLIAISEGDHRSVRVARTIPRPGPLRVLAFLYYSGSAGGITWVMLHWVLVVATAVGVMNWSEPKSVPYSVSQRDVATFIGCIMYAYAYAVTGMLITRGLLGGRVPASFTWFVTILLIAVCNLLPPLVYALVSPGNWHRFDNAGWWLFMGPFCLGTDEYRQLGLIWSGLWSLLVTLAGLPWYGRQVRGFRRYEIAKPSAAPTSLVEA